MFNTRERMTQPLSMESVISTVVYRSASAVATIRRRCEAQLGEGPGLGRGLERDRGWELYGALEYSGDLGTSMKDENKIRADRSGC